MCSLNGRVRYDCITRPLTSREVYFLKGMQVVEASMDLSGSSFSPVQKPGGRVRCHGRPACGASGTLRASCSRCTHPDFKYFFTLTLITCWLRFEQVMRALLSLETDACGDWYIFKMHTTISSLALASFIVERVSSLRKLTALQKTF